MKISVKRTGPGVYTVSFGDTMLAINSADVKHLVLEAVSALTPGALPARSVREETRALADRLKHATAEHLQQFILAAQDDDILTFLKGAKNDRRLHALLFANMSEHKHIILSEDLQYKSIRDLDDDQLADSIARLGALAQRLFSEEDDLTENGGSI